MAERGPIPLYYLTRKVIFKEVQRACGKKGVMVLCSCNFYKRVKGPCRHIYCIIDQCPVSVHFGVENFKSCESEYGDDKEYTQKVDDFNEEVALHGGGLLLDTPLCDLRRNMKDEVKNLEWYNETLNEVGFDANPCSKSSMENSVAVGDALMVVGTKKKKRKSVIDGSTALSVMANPKLQGAYTRCHPSFVDVAGMAKDEEEVQILSACLDEARGKIMAMRKKSSSDEANAVNGLLSFPNLETRSSVARKKPFGSPSNKRRRR